MPLNEYRPETFGKVYADVYDDVATRGDEVEASSFLAELAAGGRALELAIGTGRIALPLAAGGVTVDGIDASAEMVAKLRAKPGGGDLSITIGNFADVSVEAEYDLIYIVFNSLFNLVTQDEQVRCFANVARRLTPEGVFLVEAYVPDVRQFDDHRGYVHAEGVEMDEIVLDVAQHDPVGQLMHESHVFLSKDTVRLYPIVTRYSWPGELDLMARLAGLRLAERYGGWNREPFTQDSRFHISIYGHESAGL